MFNEADNQKKFTDLKVKKRDSDKKDELIKVEDMDHTDLFKNTVITPIRQKAIATKQNEKKKEKRPKSKPIPY